MADLSPSQYKAIQALLKCPTKAAAADEAGISVRTLERYLSDESFRKAYRDAFGELVEDATRQVQRSLSPAIGALTEIVEDQGENTSARIAAARAILEFGLKFTEVSDLLIRIEALEEVRS